MTYRVRGLFFAGPSPAILPLSAQQSQLWLKTPQGYRKLVRACCSGYGTDHPCLLYKTSLPFLEAVLSQVRGIQSVYSSALSSICTTTPDIPRVPLGIEETRYRVLVMSCQVSPECRELSSSSWSGLRRASYGRSSVSRVVLLSISRGLSRDITNFHHLKRVSRSLFATYARTLE